MRTTRRSATSSTNANYSSQRDEFHQCELLFAAR
jgi:hypothetical protein